MTDRLAKAHAAIMTALRTKVDSATMERLCAEANAAEEEDRAITEAARKAEEAIRVQYHRDNYTKRTLRFVVK